MTLSRSHKFKAQELVEKIERGDFDANDVDGLLIKLRPNCGRFTAIREVANMVAHPDKGHSGLVRENLRRSYLRMRHLEEYVFPKKNLDIGAEFPSYIREIMLYELEQCDEAELLKSFGVTRKKLKSEIIGLFRYDKKRQVCRLVGKIPLPVFRAVKHLINIFRNRPVVTDEDLIDQFIEVLKINKLSFDESELRKSGDRIVLCMMLLLHNRMHKYDGDKEGRCVIAAETVYVPTDEKGDPIRKVDKENIGCLQICGTIAFEHRGKPKPATFPIVVTSLKVSDWADDSLFTFDEIAGVPTPSGEIKYGWKLEVDADLYIDDVFRLAKIEDE